MNIVELLKEKLSNLKNDEIFAGIITLAFMIFGFNLLFGSPSYSDEMKTQYRPTFAIITAQISRDEEFDEFSKWSLFGPSKSDIKLERYAYFENGSFWVMASNKSNDYALVKITADGYSNSKKVNGVAYGMIPPNSNVKIFGNFKKTNYLTNFDEKSLTLEKVETLDTDKIIHRIRKGTGQE